MDGRNRARIVEGPFTSISSQVTTNQTHMNPTALGSGSRMLNAYALVNSQAVYEGQRVAAPNQRVFILTRNGFAGMQRYAACHLVGRHFIDLDGDEETDPGWPGVRGSGMPYWTLDSGGFAVPARFSVANPTAADTAEWQELNARWFEFATFLPLMRVHGQAPYREIWQFGGDTSAAYAAMLKFDKLRYNMLPYVYSLAGAVTQHAGTIMRPLVMDFRSDTTARETGDEYMFGPAFLVAPVTTYQATTRSVYLPTTAGGWYLFWTGAPAAGGASLSAPAPFDAMPVYVRAGSIVPLGPDLQYTSEKPADPSPSMSMPALMGPSRSTRIRGRPTITKPGHFPRYRSRGAMPPRHSPLAPAPARSPECSRRAPSRWFASPRERLSAILPLRRPTRR